MPAALQGISLPSPCPQRWPWHARTDWWPRASPEGDAGMGGAWRIPWESLGGGRHSQAVGIWGGFSRVGIGSGDVSFLSAGPRVRGHDVPADDHAAANAADPLTAPAPGSPAAAAGDNAATGNAGPGLAVRRPEPPKPFPTGARECWCLLGTGRWVLSSLGFCVPPIFPWGFPACPVPRDKKSCRC